MVGYSTTTNFSLKWVKEAWFPSWFPYYSLMRKKPDSTIFKNFISKKFRNWFYFSICILPDYLPHESQKEFCNNSHFENTRAGFLLRCQKSLRQNTPKIIYFQARKNTHCNQYFVVAFVPIKICTHYAPQNDSRNLSFVKDIYVVAKKWPQIVQKGLFLKIKFSVFFLHKLKNTVFVIHVVAFDLIKNQNC